MIARKEVQKKYRDSHKEKIRVSSAKYREANREQLREYGRLRYAAKRHILRHRKAQWRIHNGEKWIKWRRDYESKRRQRDVRYRILTALRRRLNAALSVQGGRKHESTKKLLGCSVADFRIYLESRFEPGMSWENYGEAWQIDHIMPCAIFDLSKAGHQKRCFHFSNLQPLWSKQNRQKSKRDLTGQFSLL